LRYDSAMRLTTITPRLSRNTAWLLPPCLAVLLSGCVLATGQCPASAPDTSNTLLHRAAENSFASGFAAGERFQAQHDRQLAAKPPSPPPTAPPPPVQAAVATPAPAPPPPPPQPAAIPDPPVENFTPSGPASPLHATPVPF
jgi:hypothetical protein